MGFCQLEIYVVSRVIQRALEVSHTTMFFPLVHMVLPRQRPHISWWSRETKVARVNFLNFLFAYPAQSLPCQVRKYVLAPSRCHDLSPTSL